MACCIIGCRTNYKPTKKYPNPTKHSCFYFPKDFEQRNLWIAAVSRENWKYTVFLTFNKSPYSYLPALLQTPTRNDNNQKPRFLLISLHLSLQWQKKERILYFIMVSKICPSCSSSIPPSCFELQGDLCGVAVVYTKKKNMQQVI